MNYNYRYHLESAEDQRESLDYHRDTCRLLYNHALHRCTQIPEDEGTVKQRVQKIRDELPDLKDWWEELTAIYSKVLQPTVMRLAHNVKALGKLKEQGYKVVSFGGSRHGSSAVSRTTSLVSNKTRRVVRPCCPCRNSQTFPSDSTAHSPTTRRSKKSRSKRTDWRLIRHLRHRTRTEPPAKPETPEKCVGIDVRFLKYAHDTDGFAVGSLKLSDERERLERGQRKLSRKEYGSNN